MNYHHCLPFLLLLGIGSLAMGEEKPIDQPSTSKQNVVSDPTTTLQPAFSKDPLGERVDPKDIDLLASLKEGIDPTEEEMKAYRSKILDEFEKQSFDVLEKEEAENRDSKAVFESGARKAREFYWIFKCREYDSDADWERHEQILQAWIAAKPDSVTALVAYANFLGAYAWQARGNGYASSITENGQRLMDERLARAAEALGKARNMPQKDPGWGLACLTVALGQGWSEKDYDAMMTEITTLEPTFPAYQCERAYSLLPRWYGSRGDWEAFAEKSAADPRGLGDEIYARIVINQYSYYDHIFQETQISWPKTRAGVEILVKKYPKSLKIPNWGALMACAVGDRDFAKQMFNRLGNTYNSGVWKYRGTLCHCRNWAGVDK